MGCRRRHHLTERVYSYEASSTLLTVKPKNANTRVGEAGNNMIFMTWGLEPVGGHGSRWETTVAGSGSKSTIQKLPYKSFHRTKVGSQTQQPFLGQLLYGNFCTVTFWCISVKKIKLICTPSSTLNDVRFHFTNRKSATRRSSQPSFGPTGMTYGERISRMGSPM